MFIVATCDNDEETLRKIGMRIMYIQAPARRMVKRSAPAATCLRSCLCGEAACPSRARRTRVPPGRHHHSRVASRMKPRAEDVAGSGAGGDGDLRGPRRRRERVRRPRRRRCTEVALLAIDDARVGHRADLPEPRRRATSFTQESQHAEVRAGRPEEAFMRIKPVASLGPIAARRLDSSGRF